MNKFIGVILSIIILCFVLLLDSCDNTKYVGVGEKLLASNRVVSTDEKVNVSDLALYIKQKTNTKWFSSLKVPLAIYSMSGRDTLSSVNKKLKKWGEAPVILDSALMEQSCINLQTIMQNKGYLDSEVLPIVEDKGKKVNVTYIVNPNIQYTLRSIKYNIADSQIDSLLRADHVLEKVFEVGTPFSVNKLYAERNNITSYLTNNGYYYFNKECITFIADTSKVDHAVDVTMNLGLYRKSSRDTLMMHPRYAIRNVTYEPLPGQILNIRRSVLEANSFINSGEPYSSLNAQKTYNKYSRLKAIRAINIHFTEVPDSNKLDSRIQISRRKSNSIQLQPEGTNTAGDFGAALNVTYENRNLFHGSELLSVSARGAFEAIKGLEGYDNSDYKEFGLEVKLNIPKFIIPWFANASFQRRHETTTEFPVSYNIQNRPEFHRNLLRAAWKYKWSGISNRVGYTFDLLDLNFISMPWISETFKKEYLDSEKSRNAILKYNYEDLLIMKMGFGIHYSGTNKSLRANIETAGNILSLLATTYNFDKNGDGQYKVANVAFAQYVKVDFDYTHLFKLDTKNTLALHGRVGVGIPYGNSSMLPFEKRYFAGGANSVRGWNVRTLGPGRFIGTDGKIDFINQSGDIKIDLNAELRTDLFWKFQGALFIDAGNIWTIRDYKDQPEGSFKLKSIYDEMAVSYGAGLRLNFDYFIMRLDFGMKAINPAYTTYKEHFPFVYPKFTRDYALHFAVGLPF